MKRSSIILALGFVFLACSLFWLVGCGSSNRVRITAGGATFPNPIIQKWKEVYYQEKKVEIDYQQVGIGSGHFRRDQPKVRLWLLRCSDDQ